MKRVLSVLLPFVVCSAIVAGAFVGGTAAADSPAPGDAGVALVAGSAAASLPPSAPPPAAPTLHDPTQDPASFLSDAQAAKKLGWPALVLVLAVGLLELVAYFGRKSTKFAWLGKGRWSLVIGGGITVLIAGYNALASGGSWGAVGSAVLFAALAYWHQAGTDPAKS